MEVLLQTIFYLKGKNEKQDYLLVQQIEVGILDVA